MAKEQYSEIIGGGTVNKLVGGFQFTEGPVWDVVSRHLLFSDIPANRIYRYNFTEGLCIVYREPSGSSNGLVFDADHHLIACEHGNRRVSMSAPDQAPITVADRFDGKRLNSPNDAVVHSNGNIYFTDPPYGIKFAQEKEQQFNALYVFTNQGGLCQLVADFDRPNGLAFTPGEDYLYVADTPRAHIRRFKVDADGALSGGEVFCQQGGPSEGRPDGIKVDEDGNLYVTAAPGIWIYNPKGRLLGILEAPEVPANCCFGGDDWRTLFITARTSVYAVTLEARGNLTPGMRPQGL